MCGLILYFLLTNPDFLINPIIVKTTEKEYTGTIVDVENNILTLENDENLRFYIDINKIFALELELNRADECSNSINKLLKVYERELDSSICDEICEDANSCLFTLLEKCEDGDKYVEVLGEYTQSVTFKVKDIFRVSCCLIMIYINDDNDTMTEKVIFINNAYVDSAKVLPEVP